MDWPKESCLLFRKSAEKDFTARCNDKYRITTIAWGYPDSEHPLNVDEEHVSKNVFEMTLKEFMEDWMKDSNKHHGQSVIEIERLK